jgi:hypothetical protein
VRGGFKNIGEVSAMGDEEEVLFFIFVVVENE